MLYQDDQMLAKDDNLCPMSLLILSTGAKSSLAVARIGALVP